MANSKVLGKVLENAIATNTDQLSELQRERLQHDFGLACPQVLLKNHKLVNGEERSSIINNQHEICALFPNLTSHGPSSTLNLVHLEQISPADATTDPEGNQPLKIGIVLSGGQAAGGHNVIWGLSEYLRHRHPGSTLYGFLNGPKGILLQNYKELTFEEIDNYRNLGGFHMLGSGRDKIENPEDLLKAKACAEELQLDGLVVVGGDDSNTNACVLAEYFLSEGLHKCKVIGVPKTLDGDLKLKTPEMPISFGFDTACKIFSEGTGNIMMDAISAKKYWHFIRLMGRSSSHVTLEVALQTHPQYAFISEEVAELKISLRDVAKKVADLVEQRSAAGRNYGVILVPEGLIEHVYDFAQLIGELNDILAKGADSNDLAAVSAALSPESRELFESLSVGFQREFLEDRDPHGNVQVSHIESEKLLIRMVENELHLRSSKAKFNGVGHFFGYEGRAALPSNFDCTYTYALGAAAGAVLGGGRTGLLASVSDLHLPAAQWRVGGIPLVSMMNMEKRKGKMKPVVAKAVVDLDGAPMKAYRALRDHWAMNDCFRAPGPVQFRGHIHADIGTITLALEINGGDPILLKPIPEDCC